MPQDDVELVRPHLNSGRRARREADQVRKLLRLPLSSFPGLAGEYGCPNRKARRLKKRAAAVAAKGQEMAT